MARSIARVRKSDGKVLAVWSDDPQEADMATGIDGLPPPEGFDRLVPLAADGEEMVELEEEHTQVDAMFRGPTTCLALGSSRIHRERRSGERTSLRQSSLWRAIGSRVGLCL